MELIKDKTNEKEVIKKIDHEWQQLWLHYNDIKNKHKLTSHDIFNQLGKYSYAGMVYLSNNGFERIPSKREGTQGKIVRDLLKNNINKTDWNLSTASYYDKFVERYIDGYYFGININVIEYIAGRPIIVVDICLNECNNMNKDELEILLTIDGIIPVIKNIKYSRWL